MKVILFNRLFMNDSYIFDASISSFLTSLTLNRTNSLFLECFLTIISNANKDPDFLSHVLQI